MYEIINRNMDLILRNVDEELDIRVCLRLLNRIRSVDVTRDSGFQNDYCRYWRLFGAGLGQDFRGAYFELMQRSRRNPLLSIGELIRILYEVPVNSSGKKALQFSFASKLLHTLDPHRPIYDSMIATFYCFRVPNPTKSFESRLQDFLNFYEFLTDEYKKVLATQVLTQPITRFRDQFSVSDDYTDEKIIDTLIWRTMDLQKKRAL